MEEENIKCDDEEKGEVISVTPTEREDIIRLKKFTYIDIFEMLANLFMGFVVMYMFFTIILKFINIWIQDPLLDAPFELIWWVLWIFAPIGIIFMILKWIFENYKIVRKEVD